MAGFEIELEWWRDPKGYRLVDEAPGKPGFSRNLPLLSLSGEVTMGTQAVFDPGAPQLIVRQGGVLKPYRPLRHFQKLYLQFADVSSPNTLLKFVNKFGPLERTGLDPKRGDYVQFALEDAARMRQLLKAHQQQRKVAIEKTIGTQGFPIARLDAALVFDLVSRTPKVTLSAPDLRGGIWLQLGQALTSAAAVRPCLQCGSLFEAGPGTGRRLDAKFCSDDHRIAFNSLRRTREK